jgi:hypothetical protein
LFSFFCKQVPFPIQDIYLRMPPDDDDVTELNSSQLPISQEESTLQPSSPDVSTPVKKKRISNVTDDTPRRSKRISTPTESTPRRSKRISTPTDSTPQKKKKKSAPDGNPRSKQRKEKETTDTVCSDDSTKQDEEVISIVDDMLEIQEEKEFVKVAKRKTKKGQASPVWTFDYFRVAELVDDWKEKNIGTFF